MIRIIKPRKVPEKLKSDGVRKTKEVCRAYSADPASYISQGKLPKNSIKSDQGIYGNRKKVKPFLLAAHNFKCCYCERNFFAANLHVEHFRPKTSVRQALKSNVLYPGYYWLTYRWENLFLACHECNSSNKSDLFPLVDESKRARSHRQQISVECPLIVNPSSDPRKHIRFNLFGQPEPITIEGDQTIRDLGLLRESLVKARLEKLIELLFDRVALENLRKAPATLHSKTQIELLERHLNDAISPRAEFSAMASDVLSQVFDTTAHLLRLEQLLISIRQKPRSK